MKCGEHGEGEIINAVGLPRSYIDTLEKAFSAELAKVKVLGGEHRYSQPVGECLHTSHMIPVYMGKKYVFYILDIEAERLCPAAELREGIAVVNHKARFLSLEDVGIAAGAAADNCIPHNRRLPHIITGKGP